MFWRILVAVADTAGITARYETLKAHLDERSRRLLAAAESQAVGKGGISIVAKATGISRPVIRQGIADLTDPTALAVWTCPQRGRRAQKSHRQRCLLEDRPAIFIRIHHARRPAGSATLDVQERTPVERRVKANGPPSQSSSGSRSAA